MKLTGAHQLQQRQSIVVTAQLQQAIRLLKMTNVELGAYLESQSEENPFLECNASEETVKTTDDTATEAAQKSTDMIAGEIAEDAPIRDTDYDNQFETCSVEIGRGSRAGGVSEEFDPILLRAQEGPSLYVHATTEMFKINLSPQQRMIAQTLIEALEPSGWMVQPTGEIAQALFVAEDDVVSVLETLQQMEPAGLFARNLKECLRLQAHDRGMLRKDFSILLDHLTMLATGDLRRLRKLTGASHERMAEMLRSIRSLDPKPGTRFSGEAEPIQPPDLIVNRTDDGWSIELNRSTLPAVRVRKGYAKSISGGKDESTQDFVSERLSMARWLDRAIAQRNETTLKIGAEIVQQQQAFFERGVGYLKPLILKDVADEIGMHESTVSRVTSNLMMMTPQGTFRLKDFFSVSITSTGNEDGEAASAIRFKIKKLIDNEPANTPYSDDTLVRMLGEDGIQIARRTVAKYRDLLKIPSSFQRKRQAVLSGVM